MNQIASALGMAYGNIILNYFEINGRSYEVRPRVYRVDRSTPSEINNLNVRTKTGELVPLSNFVNLSERKARIRCSGDIFSVLSKSLLL